MKLKQIVTFSGKIHCISGLAIGGSSNTIEIGGIGREIIKNPITKEPYIPGSSLKGKMRSELEKKYGAQEWKEEKQNKRMKLVQSTKAPCGCGKKTCPVCLIFGAHNNQRAASAPTRIIVRDAILCKDEKDDMPVVLERKIENIVRRDSDTADSPRTIERVPGGTSFDFEIIVRVFEGDNKNELVDKVKEGLSLVEKSYLGGLGSRGSGYVKFDYEVTCEAI